MTKAGASLAFTCYADLNSWWMVKGEERQHRGNFCHRACTELCDGAPPRKQCTALHVFSHTLLAPHYIVFLAFWVQFGPRIQREQRHGRCPTPQPGPAGLP